MLKVDMKSSIDEFNSSICNAIFEAADQAIRKEGGGRDRRLVPWWTSECTKVIKKRNKAFKLLKRKS